MITGRSTSLRKTDKSSSRRIEPAAPAREPAAAFIIARTIEEDIVLGRRHPKERLIEQDL
jgi:hypothetical protein